MAFKSRRAYDDTINQLPGNKIFFGLQKLAKSKSRKTIIFFTTHLHQNLCHILFFMLQMAAFIENYQILLIQRTQSPQNIMRLYISELLHDRSINQD